MQVDLTITISVILALTAIIVPVIGTIISSVHDTKIKRLELEQQRFSAIDLHKREILEQAISDLAKCRANFEFNNIVKASSSLSKALPYLDKSYNTAVTIIGCTDSENVLIYDYIDSTIDELSNLLRTITTQDKPTQRKWYK